MHLHLILWTKIAAVHWFIVTTKCSVHQTRPIICLKEPEKNGKQNIQFIQQNNVFETSKVQAILERIGDADIKMKTWHVYQWRRRRATSIWLEQFWVLLCNFLSYLLVSFSFFYFSTISVVIWNSSFVLPIKRGHYVIFLKYRQLNKTFKFSSKNWVRSGFQRPNSLGMWNHIAFRSVKP